MPDPRKESLDEIVSHSAVVLADQIQKAAAWAKSEMDLQVEVAGALKEFARRAKITLDVHHNVTVATGRPDSVYSNVIVEYKDPGTLSANRDSANNKKLIEQIRQRFYDMRREENRPMNSMFGVGTDGKYFIFVRFRDEKWTDEEPLEVNRHSTETFLWALYNLGQKGKPYQPEYLHGDFGSDSLIAQEGVRTLYDEILKTENPKAQVFFSQWKILFGEVCGYDVENLSDKLKKLAEFYGVKGKPHPGHLLFALHTYYALLIKLLAAEIVSFFNPWMTRQVEKLQNATTPAKLRRELEELERGGIFHTMGITNFLEGDLFAWYLPVWSAPIEKIARQMIQKLDDYNPGTFSEDPAQSRDLLKKLYQQLFPKSVRHDLGEYYTPDWLADHVLNELGYEGDPDKRLLDPACGSGTFLIMAINRIRRWYDANREKCAYDEGELLKRILANVIGFDLNPLAVMAARTNYLVAIKDLIRHVDCIEIPIYLCDSIMTPAEYGDLFTGAGNVAKVPCSAVKPPHLLVPKEIAKSPKQVASYAAVLEACIKNGYEPKEFMDRCRDEGLVIDAQDVHLDLYKVLVRLDRENKNGIWARIIKNNFAPLFVGKVDYVVGNPPWVNWSNLPQSYRESTAPIWQRYDLFPHKGLRARTGSAMDDISVLMTYVSADAYLESKCRLGFVITQTVFKTEGGGEGFRRFKISEREPLRVISVCDLSSFQPFHGATNRTSTVCLVKGESHTYPVPYAVWKPLRTINPDMTLEEVKSNVVIADKVAMPVNPHKQTSPWIVGSTQELVTAAKCFGASDYQGRYGTHCHASGIYWVDVVRSISKDKVLVRNLGDVGKTKYPSFEVPIEKKFVFPLARGRDISKWSVSTRCSMVLAQDPLDLAKALPETKLRREGPDAFAYFKQFDESLRKRSGYKKFFRPGVDPFYSVYNVGEYTFSRYKVLWREVSQDVRAAVSDGNDQPLVPDHTLVMISCSDLEEAHYICALLNSSPANYIVTNYVALHPAPHILKYVNIKRFSRDNPLHRTLARLSNDCHRAVDQGDQGRRSKLELEIDEAAAKLWGITDDELKCVQGALSVEKKSTGSGSNDETE